MSAGARILLLLVTAGCLLFMLRLVRRGSLRAKYSMLWVSVGLLLVVVVAVPGLFDSISDLVGVAYPPALFFMLAIAFLLAVVVHFSWELSRLESRSRTLAEEIALLRSDNEELRAVLQPDSAEPRAADVGPPVEKIS